MIDRATRLAARDQHRRVPMSIRDAWSVVSGDHLDFPGACWWGAATMRDALALADVQHRIRHAHCKDCRRPRWAIEMLATSANGITTITVRCLACCHEVAKAGWRDNVARPRWIDNTSPTPCARCGVVTGIEEHHWAPRHLFDDADRWPTAPLCRACHMEWHRVVTPNMSQRSVA